MTIMSDQNSAAPETRAQKIDAIFCSPLVDGIDHLPAAAGVYGMWNRVTRMWNVGQSVDIKSRCVGHRHLMLAGKASNMRVRRDVELHGASAFFFMVLELTTAASGRARERQLNQLETWWAVQLKAHDEQFGYNADAGGLRTKGARLRDRERKLMRFNSGKYELLPWVNLYDPIHPILLNSWIPSS